MISLHGDGESIKLADGSLELSSLCRDFVLDPSTVEDLTGDRDSLFSTPEPDPEFNSDAGDSPHYESAETITTSNGGRTEGKHYYSQQIPFYLIKTCAGNEVVSLSSVITDLPESSRPPPLVSCPTSPLLESMSSRSSSTRQVETLRVGQVLSVSEQHQAPPGPTSDQAQEERAARSHEVNQQNECQSCVTSPKPSVERTLEIIPLETDNLVCEGQSSTAWSKPALALVDNIEPQPESAIKQRSFPRMMAESQPPNQVSRRPPARSSHPEVLIPRRHSLGASEQLPSLGGGRPARLDCRAMSRRPFASRSHGLREVRRSAGSKRQHLEENDPRSLASPRRCVKRCVDLEKRSQPLPEQETVEILGRSPAIARDDWNLEEQMPKARTIVQPLVELDGIAANHDRDRQDNVAKEPEHDLSARRRSGKANPVCYDSVTKCNLSSSTTRVNVQRVMPIDVAFVTAFVEDPVELSTLLESPTAWARSCGLSSARTRLTNVIVSSVSSHSWLVTATLSSIAGSAQGGRRGCPRSKRSYSSDGEADSVNHHSDDEKEGVEMKRGHWTQKEDNNLTEWKRIGRPWAWIFDQFPQRTEAAVRSRWFVVLAPRGFSTETRP